jgi:hypothetical protein
MVPERNNLVIVVLPLQKGKSKLRAFAVSLQDCGLSPGTIDHIQIARRDTLNAERRVLEPPDIDYIAQDPSGYCQWIFAWSQDRRIITTSSLWTSVWATSHRGRNAIAQYYVDSGVIPPR